MVSCYIILIRSLLPFSPPFLHLILVLLIPLSCSSVVRVLLYLGGPGARRLALSLSPSLYRLPSLTPTAPFLCFVHNPHLLHSVFFPYTHSIYFIICLFLRLLPPVLLLLHLLLFSPFLHDSYSLIIYILLLPSLCFFQRRNFAETKPRSITRRKVTPSLFFFFLIFLNRTLSGGTKSETKSESSLLSLPSDGR